MSNFFQKKIEGVLGNNDYFKGCHFHLEIALRCMFRECFENFSFLKSDEY